MSTTQNARRAPRYVGTLDLGPSYSAPYADADAYVWDTLDDVRASVASAARGRGVAARAAEWPEDDGPAAAGHLDDSLTPCTEDVRALVFRNVPGVLRAMETDGAYAAEYVAFIGPRGAVRVSRDVEGAY